MASTVNLFNTNVFIYKSNTYSPCKTSMQFAAQSRSCYYKQEVVHHVLYNDPLPANMEADHSVEVLV